MSSKNQASTGVNIEASVDAHGITYLLKTSVPRHVNNVKVGGLPPPDYSVTFTRLDLQSAGCSWFVDCKISEALRSCPCTMSNNLDKAHHHSRDRGLLYQMLASAGWRRCVHVPVVSSMSSEFALVRKMASTRNALISSDACGKTVSCCSV